MNATEKKEIEIKLSALIVEKANEVAAEMVSDPKFLSMFSDMLKFGKGGFIKDAIKHSVKNECLPVNEVFIQGDYVVSKEKAERNAKFLRDLQLGVRDKYLSENSGFHASDAARLKDNG